MSKFSKYLTLLPIIIGLIMLAGDYLADFSVTSSQVELIEFIIGSTVIGGTVNAGFKRYTAYKEKVKN